jgi:hypothetical protein
VEPTTRLERVTCLITNQLAVAELLEFLVFCDAKVARGCGSLHGDASQTHPGYRDASPIGRCREHRRNDVRTAVDRPRRCHPRNVVPRDDATVSGYSGPREQPGSADVGVISHERRAWSADVASGLVASPLRRRLAWAAFGPERARLNAVSAPGTVDWLAASPVARGRRSRRAPGESA